MSSIARPARTPGWLRSTPRRDVFAVGWFAGRRRGRDTQASRRLEGGWRIGPAFQAACYHVPDGSCKLHRCVDIRINERLGKRQLVSTGDGVRGLPGALVDSPEHWRSRWHARNQCDASILVRFFQEEDCRLEKICPRKSENGSSLCMIDIPLRMPIRGMRLLHDI